MMNGALPWVDRILRSPRDVADTCARGEALVPLVRVSLVTIVLGAGTFGAVLATARGGIQLLYSGIKLPLALLCTLVITVPAFFAVGAAFGRVFALRGAIALSLASCSRAALVLAGLAPAMWCALDSGMSYHQSVLLASAAYALAGLAGLGILVRGVGFSANGLAILLCCGAVLLPAGGQCAWMLRPFLGRPAQAQVPFLRTRESSFMDAMWESTGSIARGTRVRTRAQLRDPSASSPNVEGE